MKTTVWVNLLGLCIAMSVRADLQPHRQYVEGEVLVVYKDLQTKTRKLSSAPGRHCKTFASLSAKRNRKIECVKDEHLSTEELLQEYRANPNVKAVSPNYILHSCAQTRFPNDPEFSELWGFHNSGQVLRDSTHGTADADIDYPEARRLMREEVPEAVIVILDSGVDYTHPDLKDAMWINPGEVPENGVDDDGNGYVDDLYGWDPAGDILTEVGTTNYICLGEDHDPMDYNGHGTHVAGIAGAVSDNSLGICGTGRVKVMAVKASNATFLFSCVIAGIDYVITMKNRGVNIVALNASFGGYSQDDGILYDAFAGLEDCGIVVCAGTGNDASDNDAIPFYPASFHLSNIIAVAATTPADQLADWSNYGLTNADIGAPGSHILSSCPQTVPTRFELLSGTDQITAQPLYLSGLTSSNGLTRPVFDCGLGYPEDFPPAVSGNIALIERGSLFYREKVANAMVADATGVIIYQQASDTGVVIGNLSWPLNWIPTIGISRSDGLLLKDREGQDITMTCWHDPDYPYAVEDGTSMAAPLVTGCIGVLAQHFPKDTYQQLMRRLLDNVDVLPSLQNRCVTGGRINLAKALDSDGDELPDWWELQYADSLAEMTAVGDPDDDHMSNLTEYRTATDPAQRTSQWQLEPVQTANGRMELQWPIHTGCSYQLLASDNLTTGVFAVVTNLPTVNSPGVMSWIVPQDQPSQFYQIKQIWE